tara:strand:+ start:6171 stop:6992 length:822 start_codon:yes stop_codon:yes gene_type:complete
VDGNQTSNEKVKMNLAHIINVMEITEAQRSSYLHIAQPVTIQSMINARNKTDNCKVDLFGVKNKFDKVKLPSPFKFTNDLERCCYDVIDSLPKKKSLPLIKDILSSLYHASNAEYFIYTNSDIGVLPDFYNFISEKIKSGFDSICINRRDMPKHINGQEIDVSNFEILFSELGKYHMGADCFVFHRDAFKKMIFGNVFVGVPPVGGVFLDQIRKTSNNFHWVNRKGDKQSPPERLLTFHIGSDRNWLRNENIYWTENNKQAKKNNHPFENHLK